MREKKLGKIIQRALKKDYLYSNEELAYMKKELRNLKELTEQQRKHSSKGFGKYETN